MNLFMLQKQYCMSHKGNRKHFFIFVRKGRQNPGHITPSFRCYVGGFISKSSSKRGERSEEEKGLWDEGTLFYSVHEDGKHVKGKWCHGGCHGNRCRGSAVVYR
uniref:Uncharacterized protein n=1 Tax=Mus musculus TaxID=10090 RepID=Q8C6M9_MOUSE|nr:unnamed protein product [Mus musculus]